MSEWGGACTCPGDYREGYGQGGRHNAWCRSLAGPYDEPVTAHVNRDISMDAKTGEALDEIIAAAVRRLERTA